MSDEAAAGTPSRRDLRVPPDADAMPRWRRIRIVAVAVATVLLLTAGIVAIVHFTNPMTILTNAPELQQVTERVAGGGTATVMWSHDLERAAVTAEGLGELPADFVYQLWYEGDEIRPAGTFMGDVTVLLDGTLSPRDVITITIEPAGGSAQPTTDPILAVPTAGG